jgi:hypothetical protein
MTKPSIVFAHGIWADGSCFQKLDPDAAGGGSRSDGCEVRPGHAERRRRRDHPHIRASQVRSFLSATPTGGTVITHAGMGPRVAALVYITAWVRMRPRRYRANRTSSPNGRLQAD